MNNDIPTKENLSTSKTQVPAAKKKSSGGLFANLIIIVIVVVIVLYLVSAYTSLNILGLDKSAGDNSAWKAVFLTNGQVYFGHTTNESSDPMVLRNIYYLQVTQPLQQLGANQNPPNLNQPQLSLVKLGNELHGPEDEMRVNRAHVLFVEDLKEDSRVVEAINAYVVGQGE